MRVRAVSNKMECYELKLNTILQLRLAFNAKIMTMQIPGV